VKEGCWKNRAGKQFAGKNERDKICEKKEREWSWRETTSGKELAEKNERERIGGNK
jgi:hypothetical protein